MSEEPHYFNAEPEVGARPRTLTVTLAGREVELVSDSGVFSGDRLDLGTRVLLREAPAPPATGDLLDLGCGWGPLTVALALQAPAATVWAVDVNRRALDLAAANAGRLGLAGVRAVLPDEVPDDVRFAAIWSNPPIRIGKQPLHTLLLRWLPRLEPGGRAFLVVQRHLGADSLHAWLATALPEATGGEGFTVTRAGSAKGYRVLQAVRDA
jgi:16S rRNA (guanine1207-N2)-methyltransferase